MSKDLNNLDLDEKFWEISSAFIDHYGPIPSQLSSFNCAIETIRDIILEKGNITYIDNENKLHLVVFSDVFFQKPIHKEVDESITKVTPKLAMDRGLSYLSAIYCNITYYGPDNQMNTCSKKCIGELPVMVKSDLCRLNEIGHDIHRLAELQEDIMDCGGYFIIKGSQKAVIPQVRPPHNYISIYNGKTTQKAGKPKFLLYAETRSGSSSSHTTNAQVGICTKSKLLACTIQYIDSDSIPLSIIFRALGANSEKEIASYIFPNEWFKNPPTPAHKEAILLLEKSIEQGWQCYTQSSALNYIGKKGKKYSKTQEIPEDDESTEKSISYAKYLLSTEYFPHIGVGEEYHKEKKIFLGYMVRKLLLCHVNLTTPSDRDHTANKRYHTSGMLIAAQFYKAFRIFKSKFSTAMEHEITKKKSVNIISYINSSIITSNLRSALTNNKWNNSVTSQGISQQLEDFNLVAKICFLRKSRIPMSNDGGKIEQPRHLNGSNGNCPYDTPEGKQVGLVQSLAMDSLLSVGSDPIPVIEIVKSLNVENLENINDFHKFTRIFVNGKPIGYTRDGLNVVNTLRKIRRSMGMAVETSIAYNDVDDEICIFTDPGRLIRGLVILENGYPIISIKELNKIRRGEYSTLEVDVWTTLLQKGYVELIGKDEEEYLNVAMHPSDLEAMTIPIRKKYTHCVMTPDMLHGVAIATSAKNDSNQAPRNIYQCNMAKQAIGVPGTNYMYVKKGKWHVLQYPQKQIVNTRISRKLGFDKLPMGQNATVAIMPLRGKNQEDSIIINEDAINRGFMCSYVYISFEAVIKHINVGSISKYEKFAIPDEECNDFRGNPNKLQYFGDNKQWCFIPRGTVVEKNDILIGMIVDYGKGEKHFNQSIYPKNKTNVSVFYDQKLPATVHSTQYGYNGEGYAYIKVVVRQYRKPIRGDKFSSNHGQKGIVGAIFPSNEMPFFPRLGYSPNILVNPLAFPSRMTIGMFIESVIGMAVTSSALKTETYSKPLFLDKKNDDNEEESKFILENNEIIGYPEGFTSENYRKMRVDGDATPFIKSFDVKYVMKCIEEMGINGFCEDEVIINGKKINILIFHGIVYYQRLKHMPIDKIHARAIGGKHCLTGQPTEGRRKKGAFRVGHMERDDVEKTTPISLKEGISVEIRKLIKFEKVWSLNVEVEGMQESNQICFHSEKLKPKYVMTLQDGRTIYGSINHPFYTDKGDYSDMKYLIPENKSTIDNPVDRLGCSKISPLVDFEADMKLCKDFIWTEKFFSHMHTNGEIPSEYECLRRSLALARLIGLVITDGHCKTKSNSVVVFTGHKLDKDTIVDDIIRITGESPYIYKNESNNMFNISIPNPLASEIRKMGVIIGPKVSQDAIFPDFINEHTPIPILREFLGGVFGGDGHTVCLCQHRGKLDLMKSVSISWTKDPDHLESLQKHMEILQKLLLKFNINSEIQQPKITTHSKNSGGGYNNKQILLNIPLAHLIEFAEKIGFRYCEHKSIRLAAGVTYRRYKENVIRQRQFIIDRTRVITNYDFKRQQNPKCKLQTQKAINQAKFELMIREPILYHKIFPDVRTMNKFLSGEIKNDLRDPDFPTVGEWMKDIGALKMFINENNPTYKGVTYGLSLDDDKIPLFYLKVIDIRYTGESGEMCDITVHGNESYLANGIIAHNCILAQGTPEMAQDRLFYQSDPCRMPVCEICGLQAIESNTRAYCPLCQTSNVVAVRLPFGTKLLSQELAPMGMVPRIITLPSKDDVITIENKDKITFENKDKI